MSDEQTPCNLPFERVPQDAADPGVGPVPPRPKVERLFADATPDRRAMRALYGPAANRRVVVEASDIVIRELRAEMARLDCAISLLEDMKRGTP